MNLFRYLDDEPNTTKRSSHAFDCAITRKFKEVKIRYNISKAKITRQCINFGEHKLDFTKDFVFHRSNRQLIIQKNENEALKLHRSIISCIEHEKLLSYLYNLFTSSNNVYETASMLHFGMVDDYFVIYYTKNRQQAVNMRRSSSYCNFISSSKQLVQLDWIPSRNIERITNFISNQLIIANTCNFRYSIWKMSRIFDEFQMQRREFYCTTVLESYIHDYDNASFKQIECILNVVPFLFFIPIEFDKRVQAMFIIFKTNLNEKIVKKWYNLFLKHQETIEIVCNNRDLFMNHELNYPKPKESSYNVFLNLFENCFAFRKHNFHAKKHIEGFIFEHKNPPIKLFAFLSGGILPFCLNKTNNFDDIDIYLSTSSFSKRNRGEFKTTFSHTFLQFFNKMCEKKCLIWKKLFGYAKYMNRNDFRFFYILCTFSLNEECAFMQALKNCTNNHLPNIVLYDALGTNGLIDMASCIINFDLNICKFAWNINFCNLFSNFNEILKLNFDSRYFFNYTNTQNKSLSECYERSIYSKQMHNSSIFDVNKQLIREKKYIDRVSGNFKLLHESGQLSLKHLAWNQLLSAGNPTTIFCLCQYGPKYVVCKACAKQLFLTTPARRLSTFTFDKEKRFRDCPTCDQKSILYLLAESEDQII